MKWRSNLRLHFGVDDVTDPGTEQGRASPFQWSAGAWFGSLFGATIWMLLGAIYIFLFLSQQVGLVWLAGFLLCVAVIVYLWTQRTQTRAYVAYQVSLFVIAGVAFICILTAHVAGHLPRLVWNNPNAPLGAYFAWLTYPFLMLRFYVRERSARTPND